MSYIDCDSISLYEIKNTVIKLIDKTDSVVLLYQILQKKYPNESTKYDIPIYYFSDCINCAYKLIDYITIINTDLNTPLDTKINTKILQNFMYIYNTYEQLHNHCIAHTNDYNHINVSKALHNLFNVIISLNVNIDKYNNSKHIQQYVHTFYNE